jgi:hypothetical protein
MSLRPRGRNHERWAVLFTTTTLPEDGWMTTMLAPSTKSCVQKQLSGIDSVEKSEYRLGWSTPPPLLLLILLLLAVLVPLPREDAAAALALVDSRLERNSGIVEIGLAWRRKSEKVVGRKEGDRGGPADWILAEPLSRAEWLWATEADVGRGFAPVADSESLL